MLLTPLKHLNNIFTSCLQDALNNCLALLTLLCRKGVKTVNADSGFEKKIVYRWHL